VDDHLHWRGRREGHARSAGATGADPIASHTYGFTIFAPMTSVALAASRPSSQPVNTSVVFTATGTGGTAPHWFQFRVTDKNQTLVARDWSSTPTFTWTPSVAGAYTITVRGRAIGPVGDDYQATASMPFTIAP
jgi:hypothetical protein